MLNALCTCIFFTSGSEVPGLFAYEAWSWLQGVWSTVFGQRKQGEELRQMCRPSLYKAVVMYWWTLRTLWFKLLRIIGHKVGSLSLPRFSAMSAASYIHSDFGKLDLYCVIAEGINQLWHIVSCSICFLFFRKTTNPCLLQWAALVHNRNIKC